MEVLSNEATTLADRLIEAVNTNDLDGVSSTVLGAMSAVADLAKIVPSDAQARLTTIVGELLEFISQSIPYRYSCIISQFLNYFLIKSSIFDSIIHSS